MHLSEHELDASAASTTDGCPRGQSMPENCVTKPPSRTTIHQKIVPQTTNSSRHQDFYIDPPAGSRIDYCNALLFGTTDKVLDRLQRVQNNLARVVNNISIRQLHKSGRSSHDLLRDLHWLPIRSRIDFKIAVLCYKGHRLGQPTYIASLLTPYTTTRTLRSTAQDQLVDVPSRIKTGSRRFTCAAPHTWNNLPESVRSATSVNSFKSQLKTYYYRLNYQ